MAAWDEGGTLRDRLSEDPECTLAAEDLAACFSTEHLLRNSAIVFDRLADSVLT
jgi:hypothetical protein